MYTSVVDRYMKIPSHSYKMGWNITHTFTTLGLSAYSNGLSILSILSFFTCLVNLVSFFSNHVVQSCLCGLVGCRLCSSSLGRDSHGRINSNRHRMSRIHARDMQEQPSYSAVGKLATVLRDGQCSPWPPRPLAPLARSP